MSAPVSSNGKVLPTASLATRPPAGPGASRQGAAASRSLGERITHALLRVPLALKLAGANALLVIVAGAASLFVHARGAPADTMVAVTLATLLLSLVMNLALVYIALQPLRRLEETAERVWRGDLTARVVPSPLADRDVARVGGTLNVLLDGLTSDRARMRQLAAQVIRVGDEERARLARELHDSTAQTLAALTWQVSAAMRADGCPPEVARHLELIRDLGMDALEEVRTLSHTIYPSVLDDLGLPAALEWLARSTEEQDPVQTRVETRGDASRLTKPAASVLYRVAQEAMSNAVRHASPGRITLALTVGEREASLTVADEGRGFDVAEARARRPGMGLFTMRERVALVDGRLAIDSAPGKGTRITASVPLTSTGDL
ncbi:MAG TPA: histidine kinase [Gemmatimonadaceae bacterium]|nr:histidine kinase [Gemmatimonadaceae bacterium]